jgi:NTP pyrophosphatase (non-canonical NTP hydrolase)
MVHNISQLCKIVHENAVLKGFHKEDVTAQAISSKMMLLVTECAEAIEDVRSGAINESIDSTGKPLGLPSELADIAIRLFDLAEWLEIDLEGAIERKIAYNAKRPYKHGKSI